MEELDFSPDQKDGKKTYSAEDDEFFKKHAALLYKTTTSSFGAGSTMLKPEARFGLSGKFTDHLAGAGMWRNNSLTTKTDKERVKGGRDWVENLS